MQKVIATRTVSAAHHDMDFNGSHHYYENRIFPLDEEYVLIMCRDITISATRSFNPRQHKALSSNAVIVTLSSSFNS